MTHSLFVHHAKVHYQPPTHTQKVWVGGWQRTYARWCTMNRSSRCPCSTNTTTTQYWTQQDNNNTEWEKKKDKQWHTHTHSPQTETVQLADNARLSTWNNLLSLSANSILNTKWRQLIAHFQTLLPSSSQKCFFLLYFFSSCIVHSLREVFSVQTD